jgi:ankyrin repeat protein
MTRATWATALAVVGVTCVSVYAAAASGVELIDAVKAGDRAAVGALLKKGADANAAEGDGATALHWAVQREDLESASALIRAGAQVNAANDLGATPLSVAAGNGSATAIALLLESGADPNAGPPGRETPLMLAAWTGSADAVRALLDAGAAIDARESERQQTALMWAAAQRHPSVVRLLVSRGADVHAKTAVQPAAGARRTRDGNGYTALMFAARSGDVESARALLDGGANADDALDNGLSTLTMATTRGHVPVAVLLLERGANPNASGSGFAPLHWAAGSWETAFTANDITTDREGEHDWNALVGLKGRRLELVDALLDHGADPNARVKTTPPRAGATRSPTLPELAGATPFVLAAMAGDVAVMRRLQEARADPALTTNKRSTALMAAAGLGRILGENTVPESTLLEAAKVAIELGGDVKAADDFGNTALHYAAYHRLSSLVQLLVDRGAELEVRNMFGETPLWAADLVIQWFGGGTFKVVPTPTGDLLRKLGARPMTAPYQLRPADWPCNEIPPAPVPKACS